MYVAGVRSSSCVISGAGGCHGLLGPVLVLCLLFCAAEVERSCCSRSKQTERAARQELQEQAQAKR
jgi:hypothetical protein